MARTPVEAVGERQSVDQTQGYRVVIRRTGPDWTFTVARDDAPPHHEAATFPTSDAAKLAAFDFLWPAVSRVA